jgi:phosphoribosyl 1,2-cyclic phosphodiesterase
LCITHAHSDHIKSAGALHRKTQAPIYVNTATRDSKPAIFANCVTFDINDTQEIQIGSMKIKPFSTKHDTTMPLGFVISDKDTIFGYVTDTGSFSKTMREALKDCKSLMLEADYDEKLLEEYEGYTTDLKDRIKSNFGHLSNTQALDFLGSLDIEKLKTIVIGHLSENTNSPAKLTERIKDHFPNPNHQAKFHIAPFDKALEL